MQAAVKQRKPKKSYLAYVKKRFRLDWQLYIFLLPAIIYFILFHYIPIYGVQIAFKDFIEVKGITGSPWVGFEHFERFFSSYQFWNLLKNTILLSLYSLLWSFPCPIILAMLLNQVQNSRFKKLVQTVTYAPHFISVVVLVGMLQLFLSPSIGFVNNIIKLLGGDAIPFLSDPKWFRTIYIGSGIWQGTGWGAIIYIAALAGVSPELYDAAKVDGATRFQIIKNIDFPSILPTAVILLIMNAGSIMNVGFQKVFLMQNDQNVRISEVISTYTYKLGLVQTQYSYSATVGLFNSVVNIILLTIVNFVAKKVTETSLW